jgi:hypothetical protein
MKQSVKRIFSLGVILSVSATIHGQTPDKQQLLRSGVHSHLWMDPQVVLSGQKQVFPTTIRKSPVLPFFCKIEQNIVAQNKIALKFRLGSVDYVDYMEGKIKGGNLNKYQTNFLLPEHGY